MAAEQIKQIDPELELRRNAVELTDRLKPQFKARLTEQIGRLSDFIINDLPNTADENCSARLSQEEITNIVDRTSEGVQDNFVKAGLAMLRGPIIHGFNLLDEGVKIQLVGKVPEQRDQILVAGGRRFHEVINATYVSGVSSALTEIVKHMLGYSGAQPKGGQEPQQQPLGKGAQPTLEGPLRKAISQASLLSSPLPPVYDVSGQEFRALDDLKEAGTVIMMIGIEVGQPEIALVGAMVYLAGALMD